MQDEDAQRYARWQQDAQDVAPDPLDEVRAIRAEQLAVCDLQKHAELARLREKVQSKKDSQS